MHPAPGRLFAVGPGCLHFHYNTPMTYDEALRYWQGRINYELKPARPQDLKLERMRELLRRLGDPQQAICTAHITGTKGKGSTAALLAAAARAAGRRTGLFTSPHLADVEERIQVDGQPITREQIARGLTALRPIVDELDAASRSPVTFFEIITAIAWWHFRESAVELAVMEVGLGGRFDSTNVCTPAVTAITSIGLDHMAQLGATLEEIAYQKAGIIKPGVPCVLGPVSDGPRRVIRAVADAEHAPLIETARPFDGPLGMLGDHQRWNAAVAAAAAETLNLPHDAIRTGLETTVWPARIEIIRREPALILDCAHNVPSVQALVAALREAFPLTRNKTCVFAVSTDKQFREMLTLLAGYFNRFVLTRYDNPRCAPPEMLAGLVPPGIPCSVAVPAARALADALEPARPADLVCITGSVFLAGELRAELQRK